MNFVPRITQILIIFACCLLVVPGAKLNAQVQKIDSFINQQMKQQGIVGLSIGIVKNGKLLMAKGYGYANVEYKVPASEHSVYKLASVSKHMVATGIMLLAQERNLDLSDPITKFFNDAPASWNQVTVRHLLNHTSGLQRESPAFRNMVVQPDSVLIKAAYTTNFIFPTGTNWQYCNLGYFMLADIIRQVSGQPFPDFMRERVFRRNGLQNTQVTTLIDIVPNRAAGYVRVRPDSLVNAVNNVALRPSGAFLSTIDDMIKWEMLMQNNQFLSKNTWQQMWTDTVKTPDKNKDGTPVYYGYGWSVLKLGNRNLVSHGGSLQGFRTIYYRFPSERTAIIILTNSEPADVGRIASGISEIVFGN
jgi:CubicO group peptidase (beta-lactamase class C family)